MSARFGDQLREKRRSLGLSIQQVSNTVKIRPQIVEYFELGDFASMPPRGYAQGMISSYARFLGLNPREIVNQYLDELYVYERSGEGTQQRYQDPASFVSSRSDASSGRFMIVDGGAPSSSRYAQRPPQAGYVSDSTTGHSSLRVGSNPRRRQALLADSSSREQDAQQMPGGPDGRQRPRRRDSSSRPSGARNRRSQAPSNRRLPEGGRSRQGQYQRGRANGGSLGPARRSGGYGRSRTNVPQRRGQGRGRSASASFLSSMDPRVFWAGAGIVLLLIVFLIVGAVRGCTSPSTQTTTVSQSAGSSSTKKSASSASSKSSSNSADDTADDDDATTDSTASDSTDASDSDSSADGTSSTGETTVRDTTVKVSLAKGKTSWIEVKVDGVSQYADTPVGPYEAEYTPTKSISITVDNPSAVTVTENGSKVRWDSKTSGVGRVTITVPQQTTDSSADSSSDSADDQGDASTD